MYANVMCMAWKTRSLIGLLASAQRSTIAIAPFAIPNAIPIGLPIGVPIAPRNAFPGCPYFLI